MLLGGAVLGIVGNQAVARYKLIVGRRIQSATLTADARHSWLDALSSFGALVGLVLVAFGFRWGDPIAGFAVTLFILHVGYEVTGEILHHLMDGVDPVDLEAARSAATRVAGDGVTVRGRWMGRSLVLEVGVPAGADVSMGDAEAIGREVEAAVFEAVPSARQVVCHPRLASAS
jgi:cation diffusion facilitator family transporter